MRGHQCADIGQAGEQLGRARKRFAALALKATVIVDGIFEIDAKIVADALFNAVADGEEGSGGQASGNGQQRDEKLGAEPNFSHRRGRAAVSVCADMKA